MSTTLPETRPMPKRKGDAIFLQRKKSKRTGSSSPRLSHGIFFKRMSQRHLMPLWIHTIQIMSTTGAMRLGAIRQVLRTRTRAWLLGSRHPITGVRRRSRSLWESTKPRMMAGVLNDKMQRDGPIRTVGLPKRKAHPCDCDFPNVSKKIRTVSIYFLRSYGEKWKDSKAKFTAYRLPAEDKNLTGAKMVSEMSIVGVHASEDYKYSLTRFESMRLNETITKGETLDLQIDLESGTTFKVMGMMLCNK